MSNKSFTLEELKKTAELLEHKIIYMNKKTYEEVLLQLDFKPTNVEVNNFLPDNHAIILNENQLNNMKKGFFKPMLFESWG